MKSTINPKLPARTKNGNRGGHAGNGHSKNGVKSSDTVVAPQVDCKTAPESFSVRLVQTAPQMLKVQVTRDESKAAPASTRPWVNPTELERPVFSAQFSVLL